MMFLESASEMAAGVAVEVALLGVAAGVLFRLWGNWLPLPKRALIPAQHKGVVTRAAAVARILEPGAYWVSSKDTLTLCDMRPRPFNIVNQDAIATDNMGVRVSVNGEVKITDPASFVLNNADSFGAFYLEVRQFLRTTLSEMDSESITRGESCVMARMSELLAPRAAYLGLELGHIEIFEAMPLGRMSSSYDEA